MLKALKQLTGVLKNADESMEPITDLCFWCGRAKGIGLVPAEMVPEHIRGTGLVATTTDYDPCDHCSESWHGNLVIAEVSEEKMAENQPPIEHEGDIPLYATGRFVVCDKDVVDQIIKPEFTELIEQLKSDDATQALVRTDVWIALGFPTGPTWHQSAVERTKEVVNGSDKATV